MEWVDGFWATRTKVLVGLIVRAKSFQDFQPVWSLSSIHQRQRQTDGQTNGRHAIARSRFAL